MTHLDWTTFKKTFTKKQEDAIWQYFIDHSRAQKNAMWIISFTIRDIDDFWRRVYARYNGDFKRYDKLEKQDAMAWTSLAISNKRGERMNRKIQYIDRKGSLMDKAILWLYRKTRDYLKF